MAVITEPFFSNSLCLSLIYLTHHFEHILQMGTFLFAYHSITFPAHNIKWKRAQEVTSKSTNDKIDLKFEDIIGYN